MTARAPMEHPRVSMQLHGDGVDRQVWACLRAYPRLPESAIDAALPGFWDRAAEQGVSVLLATQLQRCGDCGPGLQHGREQAAKAVVSRSILADVLALLERENIPCAPLKGPLLGTRLYGDYSLRPTNDVDVLVAECDLDRAIETLHTHGGSPPDRASYRYHRAHHHHINVLFRRALVEVHFRVSSNFGAVIPSEPLLARATSALVDGAHVLVLDPTDETVCLAVNAAAHRFRGVLLLDLRRLAETTRVDWIEAERRARTWCVARAASAALVAAGRRAGLEPSGISDRWSKQGERALRLLPTIPVVAETGLRGKAQELALQSMLADSSLRAGRTAVRHALRGLRRRVHRAFPAYVPSDWGG